MLQGGIYKGGKVSTHLETPSWREMGAASEPQRGAQQQVSRRQSRENSAQGSVPTSTSQPEMLVCMPAMVSRGWVLRLSLEVRPQEEDRFNCHEDRLLLLLSRFSRVRLCATP